MSNKKDDYLARTLKHVSNQLIKHDTSDPKEAKERIPMAVTHAAVDFMVDGLQYVMMEGMTREPLSSGPGSTKYFSSRDQYEFDRSMRLGKGQTSDKMEHVLSVAAYIGKISLVEHLLEQPGVDLNVRSNVFGPPLRNAALKGHVDIVKLLLDKGADVDSGTYPGTDDEYPLPGRYPNENMCLRRGMAHFHARPVTALDAAARSAHKEIVQLLLKSKFDTHRSFDCYRDAIIFAAIGGDVEVMEMLIRQTDFSGFHPFELQMYWDHILQMTAIEGKIEVMPRLLERGAYVDNTRASMDQATPLGLASFAGYDEAVLLLLQHGADINAGEYPPLYMAAAAGFSRTARLLLDKGAELNPVGRDSIGFATEEGYDDVVRVFAEKGLYNVRVTSRKDKSAPRSLLAIAKSLGHERVIHVLEEFGATE